MKIMFSIIMHEDGTPVTMKEWFDMEEYFDCKMLERYRAGKLKISSAVFQYYLERRKSFRKKMRVES